MDVMVVEFCCENIKILRYRINEAIALCDGDHSAIPNSLNKKAVTNACSLYAS